jgi:RNA-directed DNA polymerase
MEEEMETLYTVRGATHGGPESCVDAREGVGEALTGVRAGWAIEPRNRLSGADAVKRSGRPHRQQRYRELLADPAWSENLGMYGAFMRENREIPCPPVAKVAAGRLGNAEAVIPE